MTDQAILHPILQLQHITAGYGAAPVLKDIHLSINAGECVAIIGHNGAGKSSVLKVMNGLLPVQAGHVVWQGQKINPDPRQMVMNGLVMVPQGKRVFPSMSVRQNIELGAMKGAPSHLRQQFDRVMSFFSVLSEHLQRPAGFLSGGQQQMVALARGLMSEPQMMLLDEPTLGLAPIRVQTLVDLLSQIQSQLNISLVIVEHNLASFSGLVQRACVLEHGEMIACGTADDPAIMQAMQRYFAA